MTDAPQPLAGLRVLDVGTRISAPFCAAILGEQGAEVIKVEDPRGGDFMRGIGPFEDGYSLWWAVEGRGRKSVTCDLRSERGQELFRSLAAHADVVVENFRPGTVERWNIGADDLPDRIVYVRISAFGQDGPYRGRPGLDRVGIAVGGLLHLTGEPDRPPVRPGITLSDYLTGVFAAEAAVAALYERDARGSGPGREGGTGVGRVIDAPLYGSILRVLEWTIAGHDHLDVVRGRHGNRIPTSAPMDNFPCADQVVVCIAAGSDANFARLCAAMERPELPEDPRFDTLTHRVEHSDELHAIVAAWCASLPSEEVEQRCLASNVPAARAYTAADIAADPHLAARGDLVTVEDPVVGSIRQQAPYPRFDGVPPPVPSGAPRLGEHDDEVWGELVGLSDADLADLRAAGILRT